MPKSTNYYLVNGQSTWLDQSKARLKQCIDEGARIAYWCSDEHGRPTNHRCVDFPEASPGFVFEVEGQLNPCSERALHATFEPHRWKGCRIWVVALWGEVKEEDRKLCALKREIIDEIKLEDEMPPQVGVKVGYKKLASADLRGADLAGADLQGANLAGADLQGADLQGADLQRAVLQGVDLARADLQGANLRVADLKGANLRGANLQRADLKWVNLEGANLRGVNIRVADLQGALTSEALISQKLILQELSSRIKILNSG